MPSPPLSIVQSLSPRIAVLTSDDVIATCEANGCRGLEELLRPWEGGTERVSILSNTLTPAIHPTFPVRFVSYDSVFTNPAASSPNPDMVVDLISSFVGQRSPEQEQHYPLTRSLLLSSRPLTPHETFNHPVGIVYAVSTSTPDPLGTLAKLHAQTMGAMGSSVPWMDGINVLKLFVVVHDVSKMGEDLRPAQELLAGVKKAHGPHSTLLVINSQVESRAGPPSPDISTHPSIPLPRPFTPDNVSPSALSQVYASALSSLTLSPMAAAVAVSDGATADEPSSPSKPPRRKLYGAKLTAEDTQRLAALVRELVVQSLIPWMEARVREWNEVYHQNRRGITGRLFGAGRKLFGSRPNSPAPNAAQAGYNSVKGYYPTFAVEALSRRLADFAFMLRDYRYAAGVYDSLRRDYAQDRAWRYSAAATEMYGLSLLLSHNFFLPTSPPTSTPSPFTTLQHTDISSWLEQAVLAYHGRAPANQIQLDALRISALYYEAWKAIGEWRGVGAALVKGAGEADEVPSAVLIEEASMADVKGGKSQRGKRRRAFHLVMAARRYETAGLKKYSRRCLDRASQIYRSSPWTAAQDRIEYSLGRQAYTLGESDVAVEHFLRLLRREDTGVPGSQNMILEDMALAYEQLAARPELLEGAKDRLELPTPVFDIAKTRVVVNGASGSGTSESWRRLEQHAFKTWDRKGKRPMSLLPDEKILTAAVDETFQIELVATNPLNSPLVLKDLTVVTDQPDAVDIQIVPEVLLDAYETRTISLSITPSRTSTVTILSASYLFHRFFPCSQPLKRKGPRLHVTKAQRLQPIYGEDRSLTVDVVGARPRVVHEFVDAPDQMYAGEEVHAAVRLRNVGKIDVAQLQLVSSEPGMIGQDTQQIHTSNTPNEIAHSEPISLHHETLSAGESIDVPIIFRSSRSGTIHLSGLLLFSTGEDSSTSSIGFSRQVMVYPSLTIAGQIKEAREGAYLLAMDVRNASNSVMQLDAFQAVSAAWQISSGSSSPVPLLHPNQTFRRVLSIHAGQKNGDVMQKELLDRLGAMLGGRTDDLPPVKHEQIASIGDALSPTCQEGFRLSRMKYRTAYLDQHFPAISQDLSWSIFPLLEPLDLDLAISWSIPSTSRRGNTFLHAIQPHPQFSIVEELRRQVDAVLASGGKQQRTMYEETGRLRRVLVDSVLEGVLAQEDDPIRVRAVFPDAKRGVVEHDFETGPATLPVSFEIRNRSPALSARYILRLTSKEGLQYLGSLIHRGQLQPGGSTLVSSAVLALEVDTSIRLAWELESETGESVGGEEWVVRRSWSRAEEGGKVDVVDRSQGS